MLFPDKCVFTQIIYALSYVRLGLFCFLGLPIKFNFAVSSEGKFGRKNQTTHAGRIARLNKSVVSYFLNHVDNWGQKLQHYYKYNFR